MSEGRSHLRDSLIYGDLWADPLVREQFEEGTRTRSWLQILGWLAQAHADVGAIPAAAAERIALVCRTGTPPLADIGLRTRASGHSTLALLEWVQAEVGSEASGYVGVATTVQDLTDAWTAATLAFVGARLRDGLSDIVAQLRSAAASYRAVPILARTHGQPAAPTSLGWKLAVWGMELERHLDRLAEGSRRWEAVGIGGSVGAMAYWGPDAFALARAFARRSGLPESAPWGPARDRVVEFGVVCTLIGTTLSKMGTEFYQLQRPEIGEVSEGDSGGQVGSVTMPHKRNPERSEHLATLNTLLGSSAQALVAASMWEHERDGRGWKVEWIALPDLCCFTSAAVLTAGELVRHMRFDTARMRQNVVRRAGEVLSEQHLRTASRRQGYRDAYLAERSVQQKALTPSRLLFAGNRASESEVESRGARERPNARESAGVAPAPDAPDGVDPDDDADLDAQLDIALASAVAQVDHWCGKRRP